MDQGFTGLRNRAVPLLRRYGLLVIYFLATVQFVGAYWFLEYPYINRLRWEHGYERLPFQTRLLLAPLYRWADNSHFMKQWASSLARNDYFFPHGIHAGDIVEFFVGILCVLISGWVAVQIYAAATRRNLLRPLVYPLFLGLCVMAYIVHTVQNFRYVYDMPTLACFAIGFYLLYFRKPIYWFVLLFAIGTLNRETTLLLLPFFAISRSLDANGRFQWRGFFSREVLTIGLSLALYWLVWHHVVFAIFKHNASEYYPRVLWNLKDVARIRYWPQLASALGFLLPFLLLYRKGVRDPLLSAWIWMVPVWCGFMFCWAILTETRVFGELLPFVAPTIALATEEALAARMLKGMHALEQEEPKQVRRQAA